MEKKQLFKETFDSSNCDEFFGVLVLFDRFDHGVVGTGRSAEVCAVVASFLVNLQRLLGVGAVFGEHSPGGFHLEGALAELSIDLAKDVGGFF